MKLSLHWLLKPIILGSCSFMISTANSQCLVWEAPTPTTGWIDFNSTFGGAPCDDGSGCPFNEITDFEIWASEAYAMDNVALGGTYTFSACNGTGGSAWPLDYTIIAPSGNVDASGLDPGSNCAITWTATEEGTYLIVVNEAGQCGTSNNTSTDNGFPAITCVTGPNTICLMEPCLDWDAPTSTTGWIDFNTTFGGAPCDDGSGCPFNEITDFEIWASEAYALDNVVLGGTYIFSACNGTGGTAWPLDFTIIAPSGNVDASGLDPGSNCAITWTATEAGTYLIVVNEAGQCGTSTNTATDNGFPAITCVTGPNTMCVMEECLEWTAPTPTTGWGDFNTMFDGAPCDDGSGCPFNEITDFEIYASEAYSMDDVALGGTYTFSACNGTGGTAWPINYTIIAPSGNVDASGLNPGSNCAITWTATEAGTYLIVVNEAGQCGTSTNTATDNGVPAITCVPSPEVDCLTTSIAKDEGNNSFLIYPNPTQGIITAEIPFIGSGSSILRVLDPRGRVVYEKSIAHGDRVQQVFDISGEPSGIYMIQVISEEQVISGRIILLDR